MKEKSEIKQLKKDRAKWDLRTKVLKTIIEFKSEIEPNVELKK